MSKVDEQERRIEMLEWQVQMLIQKIAFVAGDSEASEKMEELLKIKPQ